MKPITDSHTYEPLKAAVHGMLGVLAAVCALYNGVAYVRRQEDHLLVNCGLYLGIVGLEIKQVQRHLKKTGDTTEESPP